METLIYPLQALLFHCIHIIIIMSIRYRAVLCTCFYNPLQIYLVEPVHTCGSIKSILNKLFICLLLDALWVPVDATPNARIGNTASKKKVKAGKVA